MDPITVAMGLATYAPQIVKWLSGSDKAAEIASTVVDVAKTVTGQQDGAAALETLKADPGKVLEFRQALAAQEADIEKAYLQDRQDARKRDIALAQAGAPNRRADVMVALDVVGLISCLAVLVVFRENLPGEVVGILSTVAGIFGACLRDAHQFEFGSSRSSQNKDALLAQR